MANAAKTGSRHMGIELLRSAAMLSIVIQHILMQGGVLYEAALGDSMGRYLVCYALQSLTLWASSVFALITGYLCINSAPRARSLVGVWMQTVFYMAVINLVFVFAAPDKLTHMSWDRVLLPITNREYWYISCYALLLLLAPGLNAAVKALGKRTAAYALVFVLFAGVLAPLFSETDSFSLNSGYSPWWLAFMYVLGAWIKLYGDEVLGRLRPVYITAVGLLCALVPCGVKCLELCLRLRYGGTPTAEYLEDLAGRLQTRSTLFLMVTAICIFLLFLRLHPEKGLGLINFLSRRSLGVYLAHVQPVLFGAAYYFFAPLAHLSAPLMVLGLIGCAAAVFALCVGADWLRGLLFALLRLDKLAGKIGGGIENLLTRLAEKI